MSDIVVEEQVDPEEMARQKAAEKLANKLARKEKAVLMAKLKNQTQKRLHYEREKHLVTVTYERAAEEWDKMMEDINHLTLRSELDTLWGQILHSMDRKNCHIERLTENKQHAQEQFQRGAKGHEEAMMLLQSTYKLMLKAMRDLYESECYDITDEFLRAQEFSTKYSSRNKNIFEKLLHASNIFTDQAMSTHKNQFCYEIEEVTNHNIEIREDLRSKICQSMANLHVQMCSVIRHMRSTSMSRSRLKIYEHLVQTEEQDQKRLAAINHRSMIMQSHILRLMKVRRTLQFRVMDNMTAMKKEKEYFLECFLHVRSRYEQDMRKDDQNSRLVASEAYRSLEYLREIDKKGAILLGICQTCRKLETVDEKIEPAAYDEYMQISTNPLHQERAVRPLHTLRNLHMRMGKVDAHNVALIEERNSLQRDNKSLQELIRRYCAQDQYSRTIRMLRISPFPTEFTPYQEASHMVVAKHIRRNESAK